MIADRYLEAGLLALSRVRERHWNAGHFGAAVIAAYYFAREQRLDSAAASALVRQLDRLIQKHEDLFLPHGLDGANQSVDAAPVIAALDANIADLHAIGHNVIFATLALKAMQQVPRFATPATVAGLVTLLRQFDGYGPGRPFYGWDDISAVRVEPADEIPAYTDEQTIARSALDAFLAIEDVYPFLHQGIVGHLLTHAHALIDLARLGYLDLAAKGHEAHRLFIKLSRNSPDEGEPVSRDNALDRFEPTTAAFWQTDHEGGREWLVGHVFKYTYSFYDLIQHVDDENKRNALEAHLAYVLAST